MTFHPCGVGMDYVRSCYRTTFNFGDGSVGEGQWFFCAPGAKLFPGLQRFGSLNWLPQDIPDSGPGEVLGAPRTWANGSYPVIPLGKAPDGPLADFLHGNDFGAHPVLALDPHGIPLECLPTFGAYDQSYSIDYDT